MTTEATSPKRTLWLGSNLMLGLLVTILSVLTALANYSTYNAGSVSSGLDTEGDRLLADSNTEYIQATQFIIVDYTMYDGYYVNLDVDDFAAEYYQSQFSDELAASVERDTPFDDQYYTETYKYADELYNQAFDKFDQANAAGERESGFQFAMLIAAVGLALAAYASLLDEENRLRNIFAAISLGTLIWGAVQYLSVMAG